MSKSRWFLFFITMVGPIGIAEHKFGRRLTGDIVEAEKDYRSGRLEALPVILDKMRALVYFYPKHIFKEDKVFFSEH